VVRRRPQYPAGASFGFPTILLNLRENMLKHEGREDHEGREGIQSLGTDLDELGRAIVDAGLKVHRALGPGLLESAYEQCLAHELRLRGLKVDRQVLLPVVYEGLTIDAGYRLDLLVEGKIIVEVKSVDALARVHKAQLLTYLRLSKRPVGHLMNFNVALFKEGLTRVLL
jgi:GxxExxY protein